MSCWMRESRATRTGLHGWLNWRLSRPRSATNVGRPPVVVDNTLDRQFDVEAPDRVWVTDATCIRTLEGCAYLAVVIDLYSRRVVGLSADLFKAVRQRTLSCRYYLWRCGAESLKKVLIHSD